MCKQSVKIARGTKNEVYEETTNNSQKIVLIPANSSRLFVHLSLLTPNVVQLITYSVGGDIVPVPQPNYVAVGILYNNIVRPIVVLSMYNPCATLRLEDIGEPLLEDIWMQKVASVEADTDFTISAIDVSLVQSIDEIH